jgi:hypothetical protein
MPIIIIGFFELYRVVFAGVEPVNAPVPCFLPHQKTTAVAIVVLGVALGLFGVAIVVLGVALGLFGVVIVVLGIALGLFGVAIVVLEIASEPFLAV